MRVRTAAILLSTTVLIAGCGESEPAAGEGADIVEDTPTTEPAEDEAATENPPAAEETTTEEEPAEAEAGTRDNPVELGTTVNLGDWEVTVTEVIKDAAEQIAAENQFNADPSEGRQFVMWHVSGTYNGEDSGTAWLDLSWALVGSEGNTFGTSMDDYCGSIPQPLDDQGETYPGGTVEGNVCVSAPSEQIEGGTITVENSMSMDSNRVFFAIP